MRPFSWYNFGKQNDDIKFKTSVKYTDILEVENFELETYLKKIRSVRRQEYRKADVLIEDSNDIDLFIEMYIKTFQRQNIEVRKDYLSSIENICNKAIRLGYGFLTKAINANETVSMNLFIYDNNFAYYLFGANNPELRVSGGSVALLLANIDRLAKMGIKKIDFVGVNSPNRGDFKLSLGCELFPYYEVQSYSGVET